MQRTTYHGCADLIAISTKKKKKKKKEKERKKKSQNITEEILG